MTQEENGEAEQIFPQKWEKRTRTLWRAGYVSARMSWTHVIQMTLIIRTVVGGLVVRNLRQNQGTHVPRSRGGSVTRIEFRRSNFQTRQGTSPLDPDPMLRFRYGSYGRGSAFAPSGPSLQLRKTCLRLRRYLTELRTTRKPRQLLRLDGESQLRFADRQPPAALSQLPPRTTRSEPPDGPCGSLPADDL